MSFLDQLTRSSETMCLPVEAGNFQLSIQGSRTHYCTPRITLDNPVDYSAFEVAIFEGEEWINPLYDKRFEPIKEHFEDCWEHSEECGVGGYIPTEKVQILYDFCLGLPQAIVSNESPSNEVTAAVEGILTEEELKERNRLLVLENDELLEETKLRNNYESFLRSVIMGRETLQEDHDFEWFKKKWKSIKKPTLEELK